MRGRLVLVLAAVTMTGLLTTNVARATHCKSFDIHTGPVASGQDVAQGMPTNAGIGCAAAAVTDVDTNYITPGATKAQVRVNSNNGNVLPTGTIRFNNATGQALQFHLETVRGQWLSQVFNIPTGTTTIAATVALSTGGGTVTYRQLS